MKIKLLIAVAVLTLLYAGKITFDAAKAQTASGLGSALVAAALQQPGSVLPTDLMVSYRGATGTSVVAPASTIISNASAASVSLLLASATPAAAGTLVASATPTAAAIVYSAAGTPLPSCTAPLLGASAVVSDATTATYAGAYASGGAQVRRVLCTGAGGWITN